MWNASELLTNHLYLIHRQHLVPRNYHPNFIRILSRMHQNYSSAPPSRAHTRQLLDRAALLKKSSTPSFPRQHPSRCRLRRRRDPDAPPPHCLCHLLHPQLLPRPRRRHVDERVARRRRRGRGGVGVVGGGGHAGGGGGASPRCVARAFRVGVPAVRDGCTACRRPGRLVCPIPRIFLNPFCLLLFSQSYSME
jgi:hypothetical protein